ncbi:TPA: hypothetical protein N0F65_010159 [Lagenidium giganteum]|uniref:Uncharacterized protein n=1 Tax=Lagenidium giganteum TaxID=4803 RepID=A0AAV2Z6S9_9STRA|nr:TPA: hypothetical protein N0F65_010159 [Lagenidium giganteum]
MQWRVAQVVVPPTRQVLAAHTLHGAEPHPLMTDGNVSAEASSAGAVTDAHADAASAANAAKGVGSSGEVAEKKTLEHKRSNQELVQLQDGDIDPLGVLGMGAGPSTTSFDAKATTADRIVVSDGLMTDASGRSLPAPTLKHKWKAHKDRVLAKYASYTFKIKASMLEVNELENEISWTSKATYQPTDEPVAADDIHVVRKTRARLEQLERRASGAGSCPGEDQTLELSQSEYIERVHNMQEELVSAWKQNQKVAALRMAIKCVKLLGDTNTSLELYPCVYVLVSDVLDCFGELVFDRIKARASEDENGQPLPIPLSETFTSADVNIQAKETCRNWFYKTACIRELLPRIYIEIALLKCYRFLCDGEYVQIVSRLSNMIKGIGEPMVALYARLYLALASQDLLPTHDKTAVLSSLYDYFFTFNQFQLNKLGSWCANHEMTLTTYLSLHSPAVEWLMKCAAQGASQDTFDALLAHYQQFSDNSMVLKHLCESFGAEFYASKPLSILYLMRTSTLSQFSKCHLYSILALQLSAYGTLGQTKQDKLHFLNEVWTSITSQEDIVQYMECAASFMKLIIAHFSHREALILLKDVVRHLNCATPDELTSKVYNMLGALIENVVFGAQRHFQFFTRLIPSAEFLTLMGMFKREASVGVAKKVLQAFVNSELKKGKNNSGTLRLHVIGPEAGVAHTLFVICCRVHDSLDSLSSTSERIEATRDICAFISRLGATDHLQTLHSEAELVEEEEALLMLYVDCRSAFYKLEQVKVELCKYVISLAMRVHRRVVTAEHGTNRQTSGPTKNSRNFIKSCLAYAHITIPSISDSLLRLELMILCAKVALVNGCLPQMDAFLKGAIVLIADLDPSKITTSSAVDNSWSCVNASAPTETWSDTFSVLPTGDGKVLLRLLSDLMSVLIYAPSINDDDPFYFMNALRKAVLERMEWSSMASLVRTQITASALKVHVLLLMLQLQGIWGQSKIPNRIEGVDSNDVLYGGHDEFRDGVQAAFNSTIDGILREIEITAKHNGDARTARFAKAELMMDFINTVAPYLHLEEEENLLAINPSPATGQSMAKSGATLLCKCVRFTESTLTQLESLEKDLVGNEKKRVQWLRSYHATTSAYLNELIRSVIATRPLVNATTKKAVDELLHVIKRKGEAPAF